MAICQKQCYLHTILCYRYRVPYMYKLCCAVLCIYMHATITVQ